MRIISTGHKMTLVNGFRAHHNGFVEADFQVVAEGLVFCKDRGLKSRGHPLGRGRCAGLQKRVSKVTVSSELCQRFSK